MHNNEIDYDYKEVSSQDDLDIDDSGNKKSNLEKGKRLKAEQKEAENFWKEVLGSEIGRREIWKIILESHAFEERFACGPNGFPQTEATWFHAGEQAFGLRLYHSLMKIDAENIFKMHKENDFRFVSNSETESAI